MAEAGLINGTSVDPPLHPAHRLLVPGMAASSIVRNRVAGSHGYSRMPPLGTSVVDAGAVELIDDYLQLEAAQHQTYHEWRASHFGAEPAPVSEPDADADGDTKSNHWEWLTSTNPNDDASHWMPLIRPKEGVGALIEFRGLGNRTVRIRRSTDLVNWGPCEIPANDGMPLNPDTVFEFVEPSLEGRGFFRFEVRERSVAGGA